MKLKTIPLLPDPDYRFTGQPFEFGYINGINWRVTKEYSYRTKLGEISTVRPGFIFDFASVPRLLQWLYPPAGDGDSFYGIAAMWHDWTLEHKMIGGRPVERYECDDLFLEIMTYLKVDKHTVRVMYDAVHLNTWWKEKRGIPFQTSENQIKENAT